MNKLIGLVGDDKPTSHGGIAQEGIIDTILNLFRGKKGEEDKSFDEPMYKWLDAHVDKDRLKPGVELKEGVITIPMSHAGIFFDGRKPLTSVSEVIARFHRDALELKKIFAQNKGQMDRLASAFDKFNDEIEDMDEETWDELRTIILKYRGKFEPTLLRGFHEPSYKFLGNRKVGFVGKRYGFMQFLTDESEAQPVDKVQFESITEEEVTTLIKTAQTIASMWVELYVYIDELPMSVDASDPPFRGFSDELFDDEEVMKVMNPAFSFSEENSALFTQIEERLDELSSGLWKLVRASVVSKDAKAA